MTLGFCLAILCFAAPAALSGGVLAPSTQPKPAGLKAVMQDDGCLILEGERKVFFYQRSDKSLEGKFTRANYLHPLYDLEGNVLTEDFPKDHFHHRGIFWAWHQLSVGGKRVGDSWGAENFAWDVQDVAVLQPDARRIALRIKAVWKSSLWLDGSGRQKPLVLETTTITVHPASADARKIDFHIRLLALEAEMRIGGSEDEKGYGGFSARIRLPENKKFTGRDGEVEPKITAVAAGPWMDLSGVFDGSGKTSGVAILTHPSLPAFPPPWILRQRPGMQNVVYPGREAVPLSAERPLDLRYRMILHRGDARQARIDQLQREYEKERFR